MVVVFKNYLNKRIKGKIDSEIFALRKDLYQHIFGNFEFPLFAERIIRKSVNKQRLVSRHIKKIEKYAKSKHIVLTEKQQKYINQLIEYKDCNSIDDWQQLNELIKTNENIMDVSLFYSIIFVKINLIEWIIILIAVSLWYLSL